MSDRQVEQVKVAERIQDLWLEKMEAKLQNGEATSTDFATLLRFLEHNGWSVDPKRVPKGLRDMLSSEVSFEDDEEDDNPPIKLAR